MRWKVTALVAGLALLAACQSQPEVIEPDPTDSATASPAPSMPAQAKEDSQEGATAFVAYWVDVFNHAARTGDVEQFDRLADDCDGCANYSSTMTESAEAGESPAGDLWSFRDALVKKATDGRWDVAARIDATEEEGDVTYTLGFVLELRAGGFVVKELYEAEGLS